MTTVIAMISIIFMMHHPIILNKLAASTAPILAVSNCKKAIKQVGGVKKTRNNMPPCHTCVPTPKSAHKRMNQNLQIFAYFTMDVFYVIN